MLTHAVLLQCWHLKTGLINRGRNTVLITRGKLHYCVCVISEDEDERKTQTFMMNLYMKYVFKNTFVSFLYVCEK